MKTVIKTCGCRATYSKQEWDALPIRGVQVTEDAQNVYHLELKNCIRCLSTLAMDEEVTKKSLK